MVLLDEANTQQIVVHMLVTCQKHIRVRIRFWVEVTLRLRIRARVRFWVAVKVRVGIRARFRVRFWLRLGTVRFGIMEVSS